MFLEPGVSCVNLFRFLNFHGFLIIAFPEKLVFLTKEFLVRDMNGKYFKLKSGGLNKDVLGGIFRQLLLAGRSPGTVCVR